MNVNKPTAILAHTLLDGKRFQSSTFRANTTLIRLIWGTKPLALCNDGAFFCLILTRQGPDQVAGPGSSDARAGLGTPPRHIIERENGAHDCDMGLRLAREKNNSSAVLDGHDDRQSRGWAASVHHLLTR